MRSENQPVSAHNPLDVWGVRVYRYMYFVIFKHWLLVEMLIELNGYSKFFKKFDVKANSLVHTIHWVFGSVLRLIKAKC